jgi:hypothetical protein
MASGRSRRAKDTTSTASKTNPNPGRGSGSTSPQTGPAIKLVATDVGVKRESRRITTRGMLSGAVIIGGNAILQRYFRDGGVGGVVSITIVSLAFLYFLGCVWAYLRLFHTRLVLRRNTWIEWYAVPASIGIAGIELLQLVKLARPEWSREEIRTLHPFRQARKLTLTEPVTVWAAGNSKRSMILSPVGGDHVLRAVRWPGLVVRLLNRAFSKREDG